MHVNYVIYAFFIKCNFFLTKKGVVGPKLQFCMGTLVPEFDKQREELPTLVNSVIGTLSDFFIHSLRFIRHVLIYLLKTTY